MDEGNKDYPLTFTDAAKAAIQKVIDEQGVPSDYLLRVGIRGGGCGAGGYILGFDQAREHDRQYRGGPFDLLVDARHLMYVLGMEVDYVEEGEVQGFVFNSPVYSKESAGDRG